MIGNQNFRGLVGQRTEFLLSYQLRPELARQTPNHNYCLTLASCKGFDLDRGYCCWLDGLAIREDRHIKVCRGLNS